MLDLKDINVTLSKDTPLATHVLQNLQLSIQTGEFVCIVGNNGCGKSTLFNVIAGVIQPDSGKIVINQKDVTAQNSIQRVKDVALVMQDPRLGTIANMTVAENLNMALKRGSRRLLIAHNSQKRLQLFKDKLALLGMGLENKLGQIVGNLSGGQRQALSLIMATIADYKILLLDEITAALDPASCEQVMALAIRLVREEKRTALMITHNMQHALSCGTRTLLMRNGKIVRVFDMEARNNMNVTELALSISA